MATITPTLLTGSGQRTVTQTTLTASDTFTYKPGTGQILILRNGTGGALTPVIDGAGGTTAGAPGIGSIDVSSGYSVGSVAAAAVKAIPLDTISAYLQGTIAVTGGTGISAILLNPQA